MNSELPIRNDLRAQWNNERIGHMSLILSEQAKIGKRADNGFKKEAWQFAVKTMNDHYETNYTKEQLKNKYNTVSHYHSFLYGQQTHKF